MASDDAYPTDEAPVDGSCARCAQNIPAWLTFTLGKGGRVYCSEYCQRLDEESSEIPQQVRQAAEDNVRSANGPATGNGDGVPELAREASEKAAPGSAGRRRLRFLSRLR